MRLSLSMLLLLFTLSIYSQIDKVPLFRFNNSSYYVYPIYQNERYDNDLSWITNNIYNFYELKNTTSLDGAWIQFFKMDTTNVAKLFNLKDKELHGKYVDFYSNGLIEEICHYSNGIINGNVKRWHRNGQIKDSLTYILDTSDFNGHISAERFGIHKRWYENGNLWTVDNYKPSGVKDGASQEYFENGQLKINLNYKNGLIDGKYTLFYENGQELVSHNYNKGMLVDSISIFYHKNGQLHKKGKLREMSPVGDWKLYYNNGAMSCFGSYSEYLTTICMSAMPQKCLFSVKQGEWVFYYKNGNIKSKGVYKPVKKYLPRGAIKVPLEIGDWEYYYSNGQLMAKGKYLTTPIDIKPSKKRGNKHKGAKKIGSWEYFNYEGIKIESKKEKREIDKEIRQVSIDNYKITKF